MFSRFDSSRDTSSVDPPTDSSADDLTGSVLFELSLLVSTFASCSVDSTFVSSSVDSDISPENQGIPIIIIYYENVTFFLTKLGLDVCPRVETKPLYES